MYIKHYTINICTYIMFQIPKRKTELLTWIMLMTFFVFTDSCTSWQNTIITLLCYNFNHNLNLLLTFVLVIIMLLKILNYKPSSKYYCFNTYKLLIHCYNKSFVLQFILSFVNQHFYQPLFLERFLFNKILS